MQGWGLADPAGSAMINPVVRFALGRSFLALCLVLAMACGGRPGAPLEPRGTADAVTMERAFPVLGKVPAPVTYAVIVARVADLSRALRELALATGLVADFELSELDQEFTELLGASPLRVNELAGIGISVERSAALFSRELYPTMILPVADEAQLGLFLERRMPERGVTVRRHRGHEVYTWRPGAAEPEASDSDASWIRAVSWVSVDDWLILHLGGSRIAKDLTWLDDALSVRPARGLAADADFRAAVAIARRNLPVRTAADSAVHPLLYEQGGASSANPGIVGFVRVQPTLTALHTLLPRELDPCWAALGGDRGLFAIGANARWDGADGVLAVHLAAAAADELRSAVADPPPPGFASFRDNSGLHAGWSLRLGWLAGLAERSRCQLAGPFGSLWPDALGGRAIEAAHLAGSDFTVALSAKASGRAAVHVRLRDRESAERLLDKIPQRRILERDEKVHGIDVKVIRAPIGPEIAYRLDERALLAALGRGVIADVLAARPASKPTGPGKEIAAVGIWPHRIADLGASLAALGALLTGASRDRMAPFAARVVRRLSRYEFGRIRLAIDGKTLILTGHMRLR